MPSEQASNELKDNDIVNIRIDILQNAVEHNGEASIKFCMKKGKSIKAVIREEPNLKPKITELVTQLVEEVNKIPLDQQVSELRSLDPNFSVQQKPEMDEKSGSRSKKDRGGNLPELENASIGKVVMRMAPFPSGPLHIGNARTALLNDYYVKKYKGKFILCFDDTIGSVEKPLYEDAYGLIRDSLDWAGIHVDQEVFKSDRINLHIETCTKLLQDGVAYVCTCPVEVFREFKINMKECPHRNSDIASNLENWQNMLDGKYSEGEAVVRAKTGVDHEDPAMREHILMRISNRKHPRVGDKYHVWPLLEFSWAVDDHYLGITHILRGKDLMKETLVEKWVWDHFDWDHANVIYNGLLTFSFGGSGGPQGAAQLKLSKSKARHAIEKGELRGWHDPRTWSLQSLKARGIQAEAFRQALLELGLSLQSIEYPVDNLYTINRKILSRIAPRYRAVLRDLAILEISLENYDTTHFTAIDGRPVISIRSMVNPAVDKTRFRESSIEVSERDDGSKYIRVFLDKVDIDQALKINFLRLKDLFNVKIEGSQDVRNERLAIGRSSKYLDDVPIYRAVFAEGDHTVAREKKANIVHWVDSITAVPIEVLFPDGNVLIGPAEYDVSTLKSDDLVQFERVGFVRLEKVSDDYIVAFFAHD